MKRRSVLRASSGGLAVLLLALVAPGSALGATTQTAATAPAPVVTGVSPDTGPTSGGNSVTISGTALSRAFAVAFGGVGATSLQVVSDTEITAVAPAGAGVRDVLVLTPGGISQPGTADFYAYGDATPPANTSLGTASGVATPTRVRLQLSATPPAGISIPTNGTIQGNREPPLNGSPAPLSDVTMPTRTTLQVSATPPRPSDPPALPTMQWCPVIDYAGDPMASLVCAAKAFSTASAVWDQATETATVFAGSDSLAVTVGSRSATLVTPSGSTILAVSPVAWDPDGSVFVPASLLAQAAGGTVTTVSTYPLVVVIQATVYDPAMARAQALLSLLGPLTRIPDGRSCADVCDGPRPTPQGATSFARDVFTVGSPCKNTPPGRPFYRFGLPGASMYPHFYGLRWNSSVYMAFTPTSSGGRCDAAAIDVPTRPPLDPVPAGVSRVTITRVTVTPGNDSSGVQKQLGAPTTITGEGVVRRLVSVADGLSVYPFANSGPGCPPAGLGSDVGEQVRFAFAYGGSNTPIVTLTEGIDCGPPGVVSVNRQGETYPTLNDPTFRLIRASGIGSCKFLRGAWSCSFAGSSR